MTDCNLCASSSQCTKCSTLFLDSDGKGCINSCSSTTHCEIFILKLKKFINLLNRSKCLGW